MRRVIGITDHTEHALGAPRLVELPTGPLGIVFHKGRCQLAEVKPNSPLHGKVKVGDVVLKFLRNGHRDIKTNPMHDSQLSELLTVSQDEEGRKISVASEVSGKGSSSCTIS